MQTEAFNAFKEAGVGDEQAQKAAIAMAGDQHVILDRLNQMEQRIDEKIQGMDSKIQGMDSKIQNVANKVTGLTAVVITALPMIGLLLAFLLRANGS